VNQIWICGGLDPIESAAGSDFVSFMCASTVADIASATPATAPNIVRRVIDPSGGR